MRAPAKLPPEKAAAFAAHRAAGKCAAGYTCQRLATKGAVCDAHYGYNRQRALARKAAAQLGGEYEIIAKSIARIGGFGKPQFIRHAAQTLGKSIDEASEMYSKIWEIVTGLSENQTVPRPFVNVPQWFRKDFKSRPKPDHVKLTGTVVRERRVAGPKNPTNRKPTDLEKQSRLEIDQKGVDFMGVRDGTYHRKGNTVQKTRFVIGHLKNRVEFEEGEDHWFKENGEPNFRMVSEFVNELESSFEYNDGDRDEQLKEWLAKSNIVYNLPKPAELTGIHVFEFKGIL